MGKLKSIITANHIRTKRDYSARARDDKPILATQAKQYDKAYWDGPREVGYGGYRDDGRWSIVAEKLLEHYCLPLNASVLDIGCGKGFLLNQLKNQRPDLIIKGVDISTYAIECAMPSVRPCLEVCLAENLSFEKKSFDLVVSLNTLHNLELPELVGALKKIEAISRGNSFVCVESYRSEQEKWNLLRWQLTCEAFYTPREWEWIFSLAGYGGDYEFIFFE